MKAKRFAYGKYWKKTYKSKSWKESFDQMKYAVTSSVTIVNEETLLDEVEKKMRIRQAWRDKV